MVLGTHEFTLRPMLTTEGPVLLTRGRLMPSEGERWHYLGLSGLAQEGATYERARRCLAHSPPIYVSAKRHRFNWGGLTRMYVLSCGMVIG